MEEAALGARLFRDPNSWDAVAVAELYGRHAGRLEVLNQAHMTALAVEREAEATKET